MRIAISHISEYHYDGPPAPTVQALRLTPTPVQGQSVLSWRIEAPGFETACTYTDGFGNRVDLVAAPGELNTVRVLASGVVEVIDNGGVVGWTGEPVQSGAFLRRTTATTISPAIAGLAASVRQADRLSTLHALMAAVRDRVAYEVDSTHAHTTAAAAFADGRGVCQDHAHIFITAARELGIPARYVTGYLLLEDGADSPAHHAWAEALVENIGWIGFDAANRICPTERYVRLGIGLDAASAAPIRGVRRSAATESLRVAVAVREGTEDIPMQDQVQRGQIEGGQSQTQQQ
jgi:transglutaminase-like putative cysteine protease